MKQAKWLLAVVACLPAVAMAGLDDRTCRSTGVVKVCYDLPTVTESVEFEVFDGCIGGDLYCDRHAVVAPTAIEFGGASAECELSQCDNLP